MSDSIHEVQKLMGLRRERAGSYSGTYSTGAFDKLHDYGCGLLQVFIGTPISIRGGGYTAMFGISTIDDGVWQAVDVREDYSQQEAEDRADAIADIFVDKMDGSLKLPTESELNSWLQDVALWGQYTG